MRQILIALLLFSLGSSVDAQTFSGLNTTVSHYPVVLPIACLGGAAECAANNNSSYLGAGAVIVGEENTGGPGQTYLNPGKGLTYCRITDSNTDIVGRSFSATTGESNMRAWSSDAKYFFVKEGGGQVVFFKGDPTQPCSWTRWSTFRLSSTTAWFSNVTPGLLYYVSLAGSPIHAVIKSLDFTVTPVPTGPTPVTVIDLSDAVAAPGCLSTVTLGGGITDLYVSNDDNIFGVGLGQTGEQQDTNSIALAYFRNQTNPAQNGCRWINVKTLQGFGGWGPTGTLSSTTCTIGGIHQVAMTRDGQNLMIVTNSVTSGAGTCGAASPYIMWNTPTLSYTHNGDTSLGGHYGLGNSHIFSKIFVSANAPYFNALTTFVHSVTALNSSVWMNNSPAWASITVSSPNCATTICPDWDTHPSWATSSTGSDSGLVFFSNEASRRVPEYATENEMMAIDASCYVQGVTNSCLNNPVYRLTHHYDDTSTQGAFDYFGGNALHNEASAPVNGYYLMNVSTNWENQFGCQLTNGSTANDHVCGKLQTVSPYHGTFVSVAASSGGNAVYTGGTVTGAGNASLVGKKVLVTGFTNSANNGAFTIVSSAGSPPRITLNNPSAVAETHAAAFVGDGAGWVTGDTCSVNDNNTGSTYGSGGVLSVTADAAGFVTAFTIVNPGQNYQQITPSASNGPGPVFGALCTAIAPATGTGLHVNTTATLGRSDVVLIRVPVGNIALSISTLTVNPSAVGEAYSTNFSATGGTPPYSAWTVSSGTLPAWATLVTNVDGTATISGTPGSGDAGTTAFSLTVNDTLTTSAAQPYSLVVNPRLTATAATLPTGNVGVVYGGATLNSTGGIAPTTWVVSSGTFPPGLALNTNSGGISGTPTTAGSYTFNAQVKDAGITNCVGPNSPACHSYNIVVDSGTLAFTTASLPNGTQGVLWGPVTLTASGGTLSYTNWALTSGSLPTGLSLNAGTGVISGTPTSSGTFNPVFTVTDSGAATASSGTLTFTIQAVASLVVTTTTVPNATIGDPSYIASLTATGGTGVYTNWDIVGGSGSLPPGLAIANLGANNWVIRGTPTAFGTYTFTPIVTDSASDQASGVPLTIVVQTISGMAIQGGALKKGAIK